MLTLAWGTTRIGSSGPRVGETRNLLSRRLVNISGSWHELDIQCRMEKDGARLAVFESRRENDCVTKYIIDEYEDVTAHQYAIGTAKLVYCFPQLSSVSSGIKVDDVYKGVYEWNRVDTSIDNQDAATLTFSNWVPGKTISYLRYECC